MKIGKEKTVKDDVYGIKEERQNHSFGKTGEK